MQKRQSSCMLVGSAYNLSTSNDVTSGIIINNRTIESVCSQNCLGVDLDIIDWHLIFTLKIFLKRYARELVS